MPCGLPLKLIPRVRRYHLCPEIASQARTPGARRRPLCPEIASYASPPGTINHPFIGTADCVLSKTQSAYSDHYNAPLVQRFKNY